VFGILAQLLAWCYALVPNYAVAISLFTLIVMAAITPFSIKGMRSMAEMARLQPEMKKLQDQYRGDRVRQNEEMQKLFREHGVNPLGGCLPNVLPLPVFFIIFKLLRGLTAIHNGPFAVVVRVLRNSHGLPAGFANPHYLGFSTRFTQDLTASGGHMKAFGMDLAKSARDPHGTVAAAIPFYALIVIMTASQYWMQRQLNRNNPQAMSNPQTKMMMQLMPAFYALISLTIPASVVFYLFVSGVFRMVQNALSYKYDPALAGVLPAGGAAGQLRVPTTARPAAPPEPTTPTSAPASTATQQAPARAGWFSRLAGVGQPPGRGPGGGADRAVDRGVARGAGPGGHPPARPGSAAGLGTHPPGRSGRGGPRGRRKKKRRGR